MLSKIAQSITKGVSYVLNGTSLSFPIRHNEDVRLVFYHGIGDKSSPSMKYLNDEILEKSFVKQLDYLESKYHFISLEKAVSYDSLGYSEQKPPCSISFDDGLSTVFYKAYPILKKRNIPFTVFLNTAVVDNTDLLWLHTLGYLISTLGTEEIANSLNLLVGSDLPHVSANAKDIENWFRSNMEYAITHDLVNKLAKEKSLNKQEQALKQDMYLTWDQVEEMAKNNVTFYSHTHRHLPLNTLNDATVVKSEISLAQSILNDHPKSCGKDFVSFPFGMRVDYGAKSIDYAFESGHKYVVEVGDGLNNKDNVRNSNILARVGLGNVSGESSDLYCALELWPVVKSALKSIQGQK